MRQDPPPRPSPARPAETLDALFGSKGSPVAALMQEIDARGVFEDYEPIAGSRVWTRAAEAWREAGPALFLADEVPYAVNNDGSLSQRVAELLLAACEANPPEGTIDILEVGAGIGLHARYLIDAFVELCATRGRDYSERLRFFVSDASEPSVRRWAETGMFADHAGRAELIVCDAGDLSRGRTLGGETVALPSMRAILFNYMLDVLPAGVYRRAEAGWEELRVRFVQNIGGGEVGGSGEPEARFFALDEAPAFLRHVEAGSEPVVVNGGALECLEQALGRLAPGGFVLVNDYGAVDASPAARSTAPDHFGPTLAWGLNFPLIERHFCAEGAQVSRPRSEQGASVYARLITRAPAPEVEAAFAEAFDSARLERASQPVEEARQHRQFGLIGSALRAYHKAIAARPRDWALLGEAAEVLIGAGRFEAALVMGEAALAVNPWNGASLWNLVGDALYHLGRFDEAEARYHAALHVNPRDVRAHFNIAFTRLEAGDFPSALIALAAALAYDRRGTMREAILAKQQEVLSRISTQAAVEQVERTRFWRAVSAPFG